MATVPITGEVLTWALTEAGYTRQRLARELGVSYGTILAWEQEVEYPNSTQFHKLAKQLGRPESFFFLPRPPARSPVPVSASFRRPPESDATLSPEELRILRQSKRTLEVVSWIRKNEDPEYLVKIPRASVEDAPADAAEWLRAWLGWPAQTFVGAGLTEAGTRNHVRATLQEAGLLVLHVSIPGSVIRGFALPHDVAPLIAVNTADSSGARLFSYGHELAHLCLYDKSVCHSRENQGIERWCNQVAASLFMPASELREHVRLKIRVPKVEHLSQVKTLANLYRLSLRAVAIRLEDLGLANPGLYAYIDRVTEKKKRGGIFDEDRIQTKPRIKIQRFGRAFGQALLAADENGYMGHTQILELAGLSRSEYREYRELVLAGNEG